MQAAHRARWTSRPPFCFPCAAATGPSKRRHATTRNALPSIRDFIQNECPLPGTDGFGSRERPKEATLTSSCIVVQQDALVVPGQRRLFKISETQLERIIQDQGQVLLCCFEDRAAGKLLAPKRGSYSCLARVAGLQRLPGQALVRVIVTDRVAVQAIDSSHHTFIRAQSALLRDRWTYMVRTEALQQHCSPDSADSTSNSRTEVTQAVEQVQDAVTELQQLLHQLADTVQALVDRPQSSQLQQALLQHEAADELNEIVAWCSLIEGFNTLTSNTESSSSSSNSSSINLLETAWRLSFATFAAVGIAKALRQCTAAGSEDGSKILKGLDKGPAVVLEMTDLGLRLEESFEYAQQLRSIMASQIALEQLSTDT